MDTHYRLPSQSVLLFSVLTSEERQQLFPHVLPAFVRFCKAFPPLIEDVVGLLLQYGRIVASEGSLRPLTVPDGVSRSPRHTTDLVNGFGEVQNEGGVQSILEDTKTPQIMEKMPSQAQEVFEAILQNSVLEKRLY